MSNYTRFPHRGSSGERSLGNRHLANAERHFQTTASPARTSIDKTALAAKQIVTDDTKKRQTLTEALKSARLQRAERIGTPTKTSID